MQENERARALVVRHRHLVRNREACLLSRAAMSLGLAPESVHISNPKQTLSESYGPSHVGMS
jgi:hypothetical protein